MLNGYEFIALTCIDSPVAQVAEAVERVLRNSSLASRFEVRKSVLDVRNIYPIAPTPGGAHPIRLVLYAPSSAAETTVFFANLEDGWSTMMNSVSERLSPAACVKITTSTLGRIYPQNSFEVLSAGRSNRVILAYKDGERWKFYEKGTALRFEQIAKYKLRSIRERLTREMVASYLRSMQTGWDMREPDFWKSERLAIYFEQLQKAD